MNDVTIIGAGRAILDARVLAAPTSGYAKVAGYEQETLRATRGLE
jgi:hypothetical protein